MKSGTVARVLLIRAMQKKGKCLCAREYQNSIADSSYSLLLNIIETYKLPFFEFTKDSIISTKTGYSFIFKGLHNNLQSIKSIDGLTEAWVEESQTVSDDSLEVLVPTVREPGSQLFYTYNRLREADPVHKRGVIEGRPNSLVLNVNYDVAEKYGWFNDDLRVEMEDDKKNRPALYRHKWLGEPIDESDMALISREKLSTAFIDKGELTGDVEIGADIARYGSDRTVVVVRRGNTVIDAKIMQGQDTQVVAREIELLADRYSAKEIKVDETGVGGGVVDAIRLNRDVTGVNFGSKPNDPSKYVNWISEAWFNLAERIEELDLSWFNGRREFDGLTDELAMREWKVGAGGKSAVQSKDEFKKSFGRSPDIADALILAFFTKPTKRWATADELL